MQSVRLTRFAVVAVVAAVALTGCRADPSVAAYVGDASITEDRIQAVIDDAGRAAGKETQPPTKAPERLSVVSTLVLGEVCEKFRAEKKFTPRDITAEQVRQAEGVPASSEYATHRAKLWGCIYGLPLGERDAPKEEDIRVLYDRAVASGQLSGSYEQERAQLIQNPDVLDVLARARYLTNLAGGRDISVNPRYRPLEFPLAGSQDLVLVPVTLGEPAQTGVRAEKGAG